MGRNLNIKEFDRRLGELINEGLANGIDISTIVITLDKYLFSAQATERQVLLDEEHEYMINATKIEPDVELPKTPDPEIVYEDLI